MTKEQIIEAAATYLAMLIAKGAEPIRMDTTKHYAPGLYDRLRCHCAWMCDRVTKMAQAGELQKAAHWLGFVQGVLYQHGEYTIDEFRTHNGIKEVP